MVEDESEKEGKISMPRLKAKTPNAKAARLREGFMGVVFLLCSCTTILAVLLICVFLFANGLPAMGKIGVLNFLTGTEWRPGNDIYGILPMILASLYVTAGAILVGVPLGLLTAIFLARFCPAPLYKVLKPITDLLAGIPSVVYGFFGLMVIVPTIRSIWGGSGASMLAACLVLGIMILPTIISVSESALRSVPEEYYEGSLALGATHGRSVFRVILPAARSGVLAALILGVGRAVGETMAVIMVAGNQAVMPSGLLQGLRTLTANIVMEIGYAADLHREALIATAVVLFVFILLINLCFSAVKRRNKQ